MATIYERKDIRSGSVWRVQIRRKGYKNICLSFNTREEAQHWADNHESEFILNPKIYYKLMDKIRINNNRMREMNRNIHDG